MSRSSYDPFSISREEFRNTARTIALAPVIGPPGIEVADSVLLGLDYLVEDALVLAGYECVPAHEYTVLWDRILQQMGGLNDSVTGELDDLRLEVAREQLRRDLLEIFHSDYVLYPEIWVVDAAYSAGVAKWDGASQSLVGIGTRILNVIDAILNQYEGFLEPGVINALSLGVTVEDMSGVGIFQNAGGIEVLGDADRDDGDDETRLPGTVLADRKRNQQAVRTALVPLLEGRSDTSARR